MASFTSSQSLFLFNVKSACVSKRKCVRANQTVADSHIAQIELSHPPSDTISAIQFAPASLRLLVASWDKHVYLYEDSNGEWQLVQTYEYRAPVLDVCFGDGDDDAYTVGLDWDVRQ